LSCILLLRYLQLLSRFGWSMANLVALLRMNLFTHRDLNAWTDEPFAVLPDPQASPQADYQRVRCRVRTGRAADRAGQRGR